MKSEPLNRSTTVRYLNYNWNFRDSNPVYENVSSSYQSWSNSQSGSNNFDWVDTVALKRNASSAYTTTSRKIKLESPRNYNAAFYSIYNGVKTTIPVRVYSTSVFPNWTLPSYVDENLRDRALAQLYRRLQGVHQQFDGLTFIGELLQTKRMIAERSADLLNLMVKGGKKALGVSSRVSGSRRKKKVYSSAYLEATFGWLPLFSELKKLDSSFEYETQPTVRIASYATGEKFISRTSVKRGFTAAWFEITDTREYVSYNFAVGVSPEWDRASSLGFTMKNVATSLWELTPWSFAVDYFVDVQGWLISKTYSSVRPIFSVEGVKKSRIQTRLDDFDWDSFQASPNNIYQSGQHLRSTADYTVFTRSVLEALPQMKGPAISEVLSAKKILNLAALYLQRDRYTNL